eukprot:15365722-Ditylum_brightwellii.AAC.1
MQQKLTKTSNTSNNMREEKVEGKTKSLGQIGTLLDGKSCIEKSTEAHKGALLLYALSRPTTQTFTLFASTYSCDENFIRHFESGKSIAMQLYCNSISHDIPTDGHFINSIK